MTENDHIENGTVGAFSHQEKFPISTSDVTIELPGTDGQRLNQIDIIAMDVKNSVIYLRGDWLNRRVLENNDYEFCLRHGNLSRKLQFSKLLHSLRGEEVGCINWNDPVIWNLETRTWNCFVASESSTAIMFPRTFDNGQLLDFVGYSGFPSAVGKAEFSLMPQNLNSTNTFSHDLNTTKTSGLYTGTAKMSWRNDPDVVKNTVRWRPVPTVRRVSAVHYAIESGGDYTVFPSVSVTSLYGKGESVSLQGKISYIEVVDGGTFGGTPSISAFYPGGSGASLSAVMSGNTISSLLVSSGGIGYDGYTTLSITGGSMSIAPQLKVHLTAIGVKKEGNGYNYFEPPSVSFIGGTGIGASVSTSVTVLNEGGVDSILVTSSGNGYTDKSPITFSDNSSAQGYINCVNGKIVSATLVDFGYGYTSSPVANIFGGTGGSLEPIVSLYNEWKYVEADPITCTCTVENLDKNTEYEWQLYSAKRKKNLNSFSSSLKFKFL